MQAMRDPARAFAICANWDSIFEGVYSDYERELRNGIGWRKAIKISAQATVATPRLG
jgi:hypothetical protein